MVKSTTLLCILDGLGINSNTNGNAVAAADKPNLDRLLKTCVHTTLTTHGEAVGLPEGQMGNSEVGHLNIGAGRVIEQWLLRISRALRGNFLDSSSEYKNFLNSLNPDGAIHIVGLYSDGGVHSHAEHLHLLLKRLSQDTKSRICIHLITDGRDTSPNQALLMTKKLQEYIKQFPQCCISTIIGRFYAMDRDKRWERTEKALNAITKGVGTLVGDLSNYIASSYEKGITDEFLEPGILDATPINSQDALLFWNFREDRMRQIVGALTSPDFSEIKRNFPIIAKDRVLGFTDYDHAFGLPYLFPLLEIKNHLGEWISKQGLTQLRVAETEKYPHVTYFLNGGIEKEYPGEIRKVIPSPRDVRTYDQKPEMSAEGVCQTVVDAIKSREFDLIVVNFANCDMVGHTGVFEAAVKAVQTVDQCLGKIISALEAEAGQAVIIADHGNAEQMINYEDGTPHTSHTTFPVPMIVFGNKSITSLASGGALSNVAPTILRMMGIAAPSEMTSKSL